MTQYQKWLPEIRRWVEQHEAEYIRDLCSLINIESVAVPTPDSPHPLGEGCAKVLDAALEMAAGYGMETENDEYYCGSAIYRGETDTEVAMVGHLDVVPAGAGWTYPPYEATVKDGQVIGRGAGDNKGACVAALYSLRCLRELGIPLKNTVRVLMGCHEESGMTDMPHFLEKHKAHLPSLFLVCDCAFPIHYGEKGIVRMMLETDVTDGNLVELSGGIAANSIPEAAYAVISGVSLPEVQSALADYDVTVSPADNGVRIDASGIAGHAASPQVGTVSAIAKLAAALNGAALLTGEAKVRVAFLDRILGDYYGSGMGIEYEDEDSGKNTCVGGMVRLEQGKLRQSLNVRTAITCDQDALVEAVCAVCAENDFRVEVTSNDRPLYIPLDSMGGMPRKLTALANELLGLGDLKPAVLPGGTHTRLLPNAVGYGPNMGPELEFKKQRFGAPHGADESVIIRDMTDAIAVYAATWIWLDGQFGPDGKPIA